MARAQAQGFVSQKGETAAVVADRLLTEERYVTDHSDTVFRYNGRFWEELSRARLRQIALYADGYRKSTEARRKEIIEQIKARSHKPDLQWGRVADAEVALENGVFNVLTGELRPHRPEDYLEKVIPWEWRPGAPCPAWRKALETWFPEESENSAVEALQEFFGYVLTSHARYKKALVLYGESDTGKSVPAHVLREMVGPQQYCSLPLDQMDDPMARAVIVGKQLNLMTELSVDAVLADGGFKQMVSTEEPLLINQKYKPAYNYVPTAKHVFVTNNLPQMNDRTEAVLNRLLIIPMMRVLSAEEQDENLPATLVREMHGIILWALEGAKRLVERGGQFTEPAGAGALLRELREAANPVIDFIREKLVCDDKGAVPLSRLVDTFNAWNRGSRKTTVKGLGKMLRKAKHGVRDVRWKGRVLKSLVGFAIIDETVPRLLDVPADSAAAQEGEIVAQDAPRAGHSAADEPLP